LLTSPLVIAGQAKAGCDGKKVVATLPRGVLTKINKAVNKLDWEAVLKVAQDPKSGLSVQWLQRDTATGRIRSYVIVAKRGGCLVASMRVTP
jgi:hypothetical protein